MRQNRSTRRGCRKQRKTFSLLRALIYEVNYAPEPISTGKYTGELGEWLASRGHEVRAVAAPPYYPAWRVGEGYSSARYARERVVGTEVWRCPVWIPARPTGLKRLLHQASFAASSFPVMIRQSLWRPDVVIVVEPSLFCAPAGLLAARLGGGQAWLHVQDFEVDAALDLGLVKGRALRRALYGAERWLMKRFTGVSTITEAMRRRVLKKGVRENQAHLVPNWADIQSVRPTTPDEGTRLRFGANPDDALVLYAGNIGEKQGLELVLEAARLLRGRGDIRFAMVGEGAARERLERRANELELENLSFFPVQPREQLSSMLAAGDVHLVIQRREAADLVMPSKLTNILAAGRPAVATADPGTELYNVLRGHDCGVMSAPGDPEELAAAIAALADDPESRKRLGGNARRYAEKHLDKDEILAGFERVLQEHLG